MIQRLLEWDTPPRIDEPELIDDETQPAGDLRASMIDVQRANRWLGGTIVVVRQARRWLRDARARGGRSGRPVTFLDVATGSADLPRAVLNAAERTHNPVRVVGLDYSAPILRFAREEISAEPSIQLVRGTAFRLPFADASVDYAICSLAFHHFGFDRSVAALKEMERVARYGWLVNDLRRAWSAWYLFRAVSWITRMNRLTRHDGPASVLRSYSIPEFHAMPQALGLKPGRDYQLQRSAFYRVALIRDKSQIVPPATATSQWR
jgi:ubiquinone/menaquinone biosynthesis C-methylase UbiE